MNRSYRSIKLCICVLLTAVLFSASVQFAATAKANEAIGFPTTPCGQFSLRNSSFFRIPSSASAVVTADFNNDAIPDIAAPMPGTNSIAVALGNNQTGFETAREFIAGVSPKGAAVGDFNRDSEIDLAVTSGIDQMVSILLGDGEGNFTLTDSYPVGKEPDKVAAADFNNDGWLDLVVGNTGSGSLSVYLGGAAGFSSAAPGTVALEGRPNEFAAADFNKDGKVDLITIAEPYIRLLTGDGQGGFIETFSFHNGGEIFALAAADFNNDGYPDFATVSYRDDKVRVYLNNKEAGFNAPVEVSVKWGSPFSINAGDFNGDGKIDLTTGGFVLINDGGANFTVSESADTLNGDLAIADFNGDGIVDVAAPGGVEDFFANPSFSTFSVAYGVGGAKFKTAKFIPPLNGSSYVVTADFNNDGRTDIAGAIPFQNKVQVSFQNADGSFSLSNTPAFINSGTQNQYPVLAAADFNNDGSTDLATFIPWANTVFILTNNGSGEFTSSSVRLVYPPYGYSPQFIQPGDFNNDGKLDLVVLASDSYIILLNDGNGGFTLQNPVSLNAQNTFKTVAVGDFDADGKSDLAITRGSLSLIIFRGNGDGTFTNSASYTMPAYINMIRSGDLNGDNRADLVAIAGGILVGGTPNLVLLLSNQNGGFTQTNQVVSGSPNDVTIGDFNGDNKKDFLVINSPNGAVTLYTGNGEGAFTAQPPVYTLNGGFNGAAADFNKDQKLDLVLAARNGGTAVFYNETADSPCLTVNDVQIAEGNSGTTNAQFTVSLSVAAAQTVTVDYRVVGRSAREGSDFNAVTGKLEFSPGTLTRIVTIPVIGDTKDEIDETFQLVLSNPTNASLVDTIGAATIKDDDDAPSISVADVSITEGTGGSPPQMTFTAALSSATGRKAKVNFSLLNGTATAGSDFNPAEGMIVFNADDSAKQIVVEIIPDAFVEPDETFKVKLTAPSHLTVPDDEAVGTILNDDVGGTVEFETAVIETTEATEFVAVKVRRTGGNAAGIVVDYSTSNGTATVNQDYLRSVGKLVFGADETVKTFYIPILDDAVDEPLETVNLTLGGVSGGAALGQQTKAVLNIADDDPEPTMTLAGTNVTEGNSGTMTANFNVRLLAVSEQTISVNFATADGTATAPNDYQSISGTLTFVPGETSKIVSVQVNGDTQIEPNETFFLNLSAPVNVKLQNTQAVGTITDDDSDVRKTQFDFDGDGKTDYAIYRPTAGEWWYLRSGDGTNRAFQFGLSTDKIVPADYTGDGKTDVAFFRPSTNEWFVLRSEDFSFYSAPFGAAGDIPAPADYDGDGKVDIAVFRPSEANWYINRSSGGFSILQFGANGDVPVPADFDGDGKTDLTVFRPSVGEWWFLRSSDGGNRAFQFGNSQDKPIPADYTGDGKTDVAFYRPSTSEWFVLRSEDSSFYSAPFGTNGDVPIAGDYDGDGKTDIAVWRATDTNWYVAKSSGGFSIAAFGSAGDKPVPSAFLP